ncbi:OmpH/Skp family outer membrane protein [Candidatus Mycalebacterium sp.]
MIKKVFCLRFSILALFAVLLILPAIPFHKAGAQSGETDFRVATIDVQRVILHSKAGKRARDSFEKEFRAKQKILDEKSGQYENMEKDITKNIAVMNEETLSRKTTEIEQRKKDLLRAREDFSDELRRKQGEMKRKILTEIQEVVNEFGKSGRYSMILADGNAGVLFKMDNIDVTEEIIDLYDRKY